MGRRLRSRLFPLALALAAGACLVLAGRTMPAAAGPLGKARPFDISSSLNGHLKARAAATWIDSRSLYQPVGTRTYYDGSLEARLLYEANPAPSLDFEAHYEALASGGDSRRKTRQLARQLPGLDPGLVPATDPPEDRRRLFDLSTTLESNDDYVVSHRLDRLNLAWTGGRTTIRLGRQAVTWGNGLLFNPMDLFNPFSPLDIERDYKVGDDLLLVDTALGAVPGIQALWVPRRNPEDGHLHRQESSLAAKVHLLRGATEVDLAGGLHYDDAVAAVGLSRALGAAAGRIDMVYTLPAASDSSGDYVDLVANLDYSWLWAGKNFYGFVEFFYSGLGQRDYDRAILDPRLGRRRSRGELFTLGRTYIAAHLRVEIHPLLNLLGTGIVNTADPSAVVQPRLTWDPSSRLQVLLGGVVYLGAPGSEYGGFQVPGAGLYLEPSPAAFGWLTYFF